MTFEKLLKLTKIFQKIKITRGPGYEPSHGYFFPTVCLVAAKRFSPTKTFRY